MHAISRLLCFVVLTQTQVPYSIFPREWFKTCIVPKLAGTRSARARINTKKKYPIAFSFLFFVPCV